MTMRKNSDCSVLSCPCSFLLLFFFLFLYPDSLEQKFFYFLHMDSLCILIPHDHIQSATRVLQKVAIPDL